MSEKEVFDADEALNQEIMRMSTDDLVTRTRLLDNEVKIMRSEQVRIKHEIQTMNDKIKENRDKVKVNKTLPYLVSNVIELLDVEGDDQEEDGANVDLDAQVKDISYRGVRYGSWHGLVAMYRIFRCTILSFSAQRQMCGCENVDSPNVLFARHRIGGSGRLDARRFGGGEQRLLSRSRKAARRV